MKTFEVEGSVLDSFGGMTPTTTGDFAGVPAVGVGACAAGAVQLVPPGPQASRPALESLAPARAHAESANTIEPATTVEPVISAAHRRTRAFITRAFSSAVRRRRQRVDLSSK